MTFDDDLSAAARTLHREWETPDLWPAIAAEIEAAEGAGRRIRRRMVWRTFAAAAVVVLAVAASLVVLRDRLFRGDVPAGEPARAGARLLSDEALSDIERAEARYIAAIEALATKTAPVTDGPASPLLVNLRERLLVIDAAIADCRAEIERNPFNGHLRRQLLTIYQEKRRTLEQILEQEQHVS